LQLLATRFSLVLLLALSAVCLATAELLLSVPKEVSFRYRRRAELLMKVQGKTAVEVMKMCLYLRDFWGALQDLNGLGSVQRLEV
jgi:hypothetical protein